MLTVSLYLGNNLDLKPVKTLTAREHKTFHFRGTSQLYQEIVHATFSQFRSENVRAWQLASAPQHIFKVL